MDTQKLDVLYGITRSNWGGAQAHLFEIISHEVEMGNKVGVFFGERGDFSDRLSKFDNIELFYIPELKRSINPYSDIKAIKKLEALFHKTQPKILHLHSSKAGALGRIAAKKINTKVIFTVHGWSFTEGIPKIKRNIFVGVEKRLSKYTDAFICVSRFDKELGLASKVLTDKNSTVIYNGVDPLDKKDEKTTKFNGIPKMIMTARFDNQKNHKLLIEALSEIKDLEFECILLGEGPLLQDTITLSKKLDVFNKVKFVGFQRNVGEYLNSADFFVLTTNYEGLPISIIEAMKYSLPIIANDVGGICEQVKENYNGFLVNNKEELVIALKKCLAEDYKKNKMGEKSLEIFHEKFLLSEMLEKTTRLYDELLEDERHEL